MTTAGRCMMGREDVPGRDSHDHLHAGPNEREFSA
jgi:hypothetical protein